MNLDPTTWALALSGAALLVAGGAVLRGGGDPKDAGAAGRVDELEREVERWRAHAERAGFDAASETERAESRAADAERELAAARELIDGLKRDLAAERALAASVEASATELRAKLRAADERASAAEASAAALPPVHQINKTPTVPPPADAALRREVDQLKSQLASVSADRDGERRRGAALATERDAATAALAAERGRASSPGPSLAAVTAERDAAREKIEALERLVDGVRARSRELSAELKELKGKLPPT